jgi:hypothetical protein
MVRDEAPKLETYDPDAMFDEGDGEQEEAPGTGEQPA